MLMLMSAVETGQMSAAETGQMSAVETRQMSNTETGRSPVSILYIYLVSTADICPVSAADICPVSTADISISIHHSASTISVLWRLRQQPTSGYHEGWDIKQLCAPMVAMIPTGYGFGYSQTRMT